MASHNCTVNCRWADLFTVANETALKLLQMQIVTCCHVEHLEFLDLFLASPLLKICTPLKCYAKIIGLKNVMKQHLKLLSACAIVKCQFNKSLDSL